MPNIEVLVSLQDLIFSGSIYGHWKHIEECNETTGKLGHPWQWIISFSFSFIM